MKVKSVSLVSDGIVIDFPDGTKCYYPTSFLLGQIHNSCNQLLLGYDPSRYDLDVTPQMPAELYPC